MGVPRPPPGLEAEIVAIGRQDVLVLSWPVQVEALDALPLTAAEREVVEAIAAGLSNAAIAERRRTSVRTVANQVASAFRKLGVRSRAQLVARLAAGRTMP